MGRVRRGTPAQANSQIAGLGRCEQIDNVEAERTGQPLNVINGDVPLSTFDRADVSSVKPSDCGEFLLRKASLVPFRTKIPREAPTGTLLRAAPPVSWRSRNCRSGALSSVLLAASGFEGSARHLCRTS